MNLRDVNSEEDFEIFYRENQLDTIKSKIDFLRKAMKIRASRSDGPYSDEDELSSLKELALSHMWEGMSR